MALSICNLFKIPIIISREIRLPFLGTTIRGYGASGLNNVQLYSVVCCTVNPCFSSINLKISGGRGDNAVNYRQAAISSDGKKAGTSKTSRYLFFSNIISSILIKSVSCSDAPLGFVKSVENPFIFKHLSRTLFLYATIKKDWIASRKACFACSSVSPWENRSSAGA